MAEQELLMQTLQTLGASMESVGNHVFYRPKKAWIAAAKKELENMTVHQRVWVEGGHIHEDLGIDPSVKLPQALPMSLVNSIKPTHDGPEGANSDRA